ncbi:MAG: 1-acyl-sn-glycerol-3-phosphate acyltransferase [Clostridia bacterium]|nr:1-acyl-sn-glycerol-3-phosphate acyltransferase [Clostridia bacterium]
MNKEVRQTRKGYRFNATVTMTLINLLKKKVINDNNVHLHYHKPENKTFILISNHTESFDPGYEMAAMKRYIRYVSSDHVLRMKVSWLFTKIGGVIIKYRDKPSEIINEDIKRNLRAGIPVGLHAEGAMTTNGQTGFISEHTGQLVKDAGVALITYKFVGGYLRKPRWADSPRKGPITGHFVNEYSAEELSKLSAKEITEIIRRDTYVNAYEEQRKNPQDYSGENLAECVERVLYVCPECKKVGTLHSHGNSLKCDCGYEVEMKADGFFHDMGKGLHFDNVLDWDLWQRDVWKEMLLTAKDGEVIIEEKGQLVKTVDGENEVILSEDGILRLYKDKFEIILGEGKEPIVMDMSEMKQVSLANKDTVLLVDHKIFLDLGSKTPRSPSKYIAAWRYLTDRPYY